MPKAPRDEKRPVSWKIWDAKRLVLIKFWAPKEPRNAKRPVLGEKLGVECAKGREVSRLEQNMDAEGAKESETSHFGEI